MKKRDIKKEVNQINFQNAKKINYLLKRVRIMREELIKEMISYGMTDLIIKKVFEGKKITFCLSCNTPNVYESFYDKINNLHLYRCDNCNTII